MGGSIMKFVITIYILTVLVISQAFAGLPPTTSKVSGDANNITTFNYQFPNFTGTHTGTTISLGVNGIAGGGTNNGSLAVTAGGVLTTDGTKVINTGAGIAGQFLQSNGSTTSWTGGTAATYSGEYYNLGLSNSVASNALTISLKQSDGSSDPTAGSPVKIGFRSSTNSSGSYSELTVTSSLSIVVPSGATLGQASGVNEPLYVYAQNNSGSVQLCVTTNAWFDETTNISSSTISSSATSRNVLYCTTGVIAPIRLIGRLTINETTAGTWTATAGTVSIGRIPNERIATNNGNRIRIETAHINNSGTNCTIGSQTDSWISSVTRTGISQCTLTLNVPSGTFPRWCICGATRVSGGYDSCLVTSASNTTLITRTGFGSTDADTDYDLVCFGDY